MGGLVSQLRAFGTMRLVAMGVVALAMFGLLAWLGMRANQPTMGLLYGDLESRDAGQVVASLERQRIPHRLAGGGAQILVPEDQIARLRLTLAREGLPNGGSTGYEIFDRSESLTTTPFQQDMNRLRALEGELVRSIRTLHGVRAARVHLVLPRREAFTRERGDAQASVVLTMQGAQRLDREGVQAVLHLVSTAVPGLRSQNVSIVDARGELLARGGQALTGPAVAQTQDETRRSQELRLARAVEDMLERTLGPGRVRAEASVELDFDRVQTTEERFDPDNQVPRSTSSTTQAQRGAEPLAATVQNNLPGAEQGGGAQTSENRSEETTNFEIGRTTRNVLRETPLLKRLSIAVLVDGVWEPAQGAATPAFRDRSPEELARLTSLVRSAVGFNEQRGDRVEVVSLRFADPPQRPAETETGLFGLPITPAVVGRLVETLVYAFIALVAILLIGRPMAKRLSVGLAPREQLALAQGMAGAALPPGAEMSALPGQPGQKALPPGEAEAGTVALRNVEGPVRASALVTLHEMVEKHPAESLAVIRGWMEQPAP